METNLQNIKQLIQSGSLAEAIEALNKYISEQPESDEAWLLLGNAYRKTENWKEAMDAYYKAYEINPDSPARDAYEHIVQILNFYDIQRYNV